MAVVATTNNFDSRLQSILNAIVSISFTLSTGLLPIVIYLIINKSRGMKNYRYYMLNNALWCYMYHFSVFLARPTLLFPSFCLYIEPLIPIPLTDDVFMILMLVQQIVVVNMDLSVVLSLFYRYSQVSLRFLNANFCGLNAWFFRVKRLVFSGKVLFLNAIKL
jgi:hypothetical protein